MITVCARCGCSLPPDELSAHVCFGNFALMPSALCACGQLAGFTHFCMLLTPPQVRYPMQQTVAR